MYTKFLLLLCVVKFFVVTITNGQRSVCIETQRIPGTKKTKDIKQCCPGYSRNLRSDDLKCDPVCSPPCGNHATCTAPGQCTCEVGFVKAWGRCVPHCPTACVHGICIAPNVCKCSAGYRKTINDTCEPVCSRECEHGSCIAPNVCQCAWGYLNSPDGSCIPRCFKSCINGVCVAPNVCRCSAGYEKIEKLCKPICPNGCDYGQCLRPNMCICDSGYVKAANGTCIKGFYVTNTNTNNNVTPSETHQTESTSPSSRDMMCPCWDNSMYVWIPILVLALIGVSICAYCNWCNCFSNRSIFKRIR